MKKHFFQTSLKQKNINLIKIETNHEQKPIKMELEEVKQIFKDSGAYLYATSMVDKLYSEALELIENIKWIKEEDKEILKYFVIYLKTREK